MCHPVPRVSRVWNVAVRVHGAVVKRENEGMLFQFSAHSFGVLFEDPDRRVYRCKFREFLGWVLPPVRFGFVKEVHESHCTCRGIVNCFGGDAVDGRLCYVEQFRDMLDEVEVRGSVVWQPKD